MQFFFRLLIPVFLSSCFLPALAVTPEISKNKVNEILNKLDLELEKRDVYANIRQHHIDSLTDISTRNGLSTQILLELGRAYTTFNNDSAIVSYTRGYNIAVRNNQPDSAAEFLMRRAPLLSQAGFVNEGIRDHASIDTTSFDHRLKRIYYATGKQLYNYTSALYPSYPDVVAHYDSIATSYQQKLANTIRHDNDLPAFYRALQIGEYYFMTGERHKARAYLNEVLDMSTPANNSFAISASLLAQLALRDSLHNDAIYYLALSAIGDTRRATLEVTSLQDLGKLLVEKGGDVERSHFYLYNALRSAVDCHSTSRMLQTSQLMPLIESVHRQEIARSWKRTYWLIFIMFLCIVGLAVTLVALRMQMRRQKLLRQNLEESNHIKEVYISRFLDLCSIYMDKVHQFCRIAASKISTGQVDELYRLTTSGKFIESQSADFYSIFDDAFLHIYPGFVDKVNRLLKPECRYELKDGEKLNTDLRILAFMRLGIDDSARISHILNYSINTIYAYRNKIRNRAINRDTFERDITKL